MGPPVRTALVDSDRGIMLLLVWIRPIAFRRALAETIMVHYHQFRSFVV